MASQKTVSVASSRGLIVKGESVILCHLDTITHDATPALKLPRFDLKARTH